MAVSTARLCHLPPTRVNRRAAMSTEQPRRTLHGRDSRPFVAARPRQPPIRCRTAASAAHRSLNALAGHKPAAGSNLQSNRSTTLTLIAFPKCDPNCALLEPCANGPSQPCNRNISSVVIRRPRFVNQCPLPRDRVKHGDTSQKTRDRSAELSQSITHGSLNGS